MICNTIHKTRPCERGTHHTLNGVPVCLSHLEWARKVGKIGPTDRVQDQVKGRYIPYGELLPVSEPLTLRGLEPDFWPPTPIEELPPPGTPGTPATPEQPRKPKRTLAEAARESRKTSPKRRRGIPPKPGTLLKREGAGGEVYTLKVLETPVHGPPGVCIFCGGSKAPISRSLCHDCYSWCYNRGKVFLDAVAPKPVPNAQKRAEALRKKQEAEALARATVAHKKLRAPTLPDWVDDPRDLPACAVIEEPPAPVVELEPVELPSVFDPPAPPPEAGERLIVPSGLEEEVLRLRQGQISMQRHLDHSDKMLTESRRQGDALRHIVHALVDFGDAEYLYLSTVEDLARGKIILRELEELARKKDWDVARWAGIHPDELPEDDIPF